MYLVIGSIDKNLVNDLEEARYVADFAVDHTFCFSIEDP